MTKTPDEMMEELYTPVETGKRPKNMPGIIDDTEYFAEQEAEDNQREKLMVQAFNLATRETRTYGPGIDPKMAVICAYAQSRKDSNSWDYKEKYEHLVEETPRTWLLGDWSTLKTEAVER